MGILSRGVVSVNHGRSADGKTIPTFRRRPSTYRSWGSDSTGTDRAGLSQEALAVDADLDRSYVGGIERGEHNLTVMNVVKIADGLKLKPSTLLESAGL